MSDPFNYRTSVKTSLILMRELNRLKFLEDFKAMAPLIAKYLVEHGVTFPQRKP